MKSSKTFIVILCLLEALGLLQLRCGEDGKEDEWGQTDALEDDLSAKEQSAEEELWEEGAAGEDPAQEPPSGVTSDLPLGPEGCPPPPYGTSVGDIIQNHQFISIADTMVYLCDFHNDPSLELLLIYAAAGWCAACHEESLRLPAYYTDYHSHGFQILAAIFEDADMNPATRDYARRYANRYGFQFPTVVDSTFQMGRYFDRAATPMNMFVDLTTMQILDIQTGFDSVTDSMRDEIEYYLNRIER